MTSQPRPGSRTAPVGARAGVGTGPGSGSGAGAGPGVLAELTAVLAELLEVAPERIDPSEPFHVLGFDSILTAEFVAAVNARFRTRLAAAVLYDHPTPQALAALIAADGAHSGAPGARATGPGAAGILEALRAQLARILRCDPREIDTREAFPLLGLDSILGAQFVAAVNAGYGLTERPVTLYDHPDLAAMAEYIAATATAPAPFPVTAATATATATATAACDAAPGGTASASTDAGAGRSTGAADERRTMTPEEVNALLDAVRDDMLSVDEAVTLLSSSRLA
ncbi:acyl carrier protein [Streptomyces sp. NPDC021356]|uniref:acyl carrier protein n=1 Tax=Streptomyces sp. NPDC021356 TaxID=3154900 RepID=UPI0034039879